MLDTKRFPSVLAIAPDHEWLAALERGDSAAYERLVRELGPRVQAVIRRLLDDPNDVEDAIADTFATVFQKIAQFERGAQLSTWVHRIAVNAALLKLRSQRTRKELFAGGLTDEASGAASFEWMAGTADSAEVWSEDSELRSILHASIEKLPENHRTVLELRDIQRRSPEETAATLGITRNAVKIRLHRARRALKSVLEHRFGSQIEALLVPRNRPRDVSPWARSRRRPSLRASA